jgi:hypothetical protein
MDPVLEIVVTHEGGVETSATMDNNYGSQVIKGRRLNQCLAAVFGKDRPSGTLCRV